VKIDACPARSFGAKRASPIIFWRKIENARETSSQRNLDRQEMKHWWVVAKYRLIDPTRPTWRARKNYQRLCVRHPQIMQKLGLNEFSAF
jgi:hypothetical protein